MPMILNAEETSVPKSEFEVWLNKTLRDYIMDLSLTNNQKAYSQALTSYKACKYPQ